MPVRLVIFALPPAEVAAHPAEEGGQPELYSCVMTARTVAELKAKGGDFAGHSDEGFGLALAS